MKKIIIALILLVIAGYFGYNYVMAAPKDIQTAKTDYSLNTSSFSKEFTVNLTEAEKKYSEKVVSIKGQITEVESDGITIDKTIYCKLENTNNLKIGNSVIIKGLFIGYDELLEVIKLDQGVIIE